MGKKEMFETDHGSFFSFKTEEEALGKFTELFVYDLIVYLDRYLLEIRLYAFRIDPVKDITEILSFIGEDGLIVDVLKDRIDVVTLKVLDCDDVKLDKA